MPDTANIILHAYDGARQLFPNTVKWSARTLDGRSPSDGRDILEYPNLRGGSQVLTVPFFDNFGDLYTVVANIDGYDDSAWYPVHVSDRTPVTLDLMFLPKDGAAHFANSTWTVLSQQRPAVAAIVERGSESAAGAADKYAAVVESRPEALACFLNIMTALADMRLPSGKSPLEYYWNVAWPAGNPTDGAWVKSLDQVFKQDRFFCYVDQAILPDVRAAVGHGFSKEVDPQAWGHTGATESYKQTQFDVSNVQLTFHGRDMATFADSSGAPVTCVKIEPDIDYYKDVAAHGLLEVIPNWITKGLTDPKVAYALRWMAAKREGLPEFDPLYTVEAQASGAAA
jgi:hypothetical protein